MPVPTLSGVPCSFVQGDTVIFTERFNGYPPSAWNLDFVLSVNGVNTSTTRATAAGDALSFVVTLPRATTAGFAPGQTRYTILVTTADGAQRETLAGGFLNIAPDPTQSIPQTPEMVALANVKTTIANYIGNLTISRNFNGQSSTDRGLKELFDARDRLQAVVDAQLRGLGVSQQGGAKTIVMSFCD